MNQPRSIEVSAADVESAIDKGISELGVNRDEVMVEVIEEPTRRLLGLGAKQAKVRLTVIKAPATPTPPPAPAPTPTATIATTPAAPSEKQRTDDLDEDLEDEGPKRQPQPPAYSPNRSQPRSQNRGPQSGGNRSGGRSGNYGGSGNRGNQNTRPQQSNYNRRPQSDMEPDDEFFGGEDSDVDEYVPRGKPVIDLADMAEDARIGAQTLQKILDTMNIDATVTAREAETTDDEPTHWTLEVQGTNLSLLIGRKGETLAALQYVTRLIASKELSHRANIVIDVEGYKSRREMMLRRLAKRMADQALERGRTVTLEPMPPHERRIIHLELRNNPNVTTESVGEGDRRKVTIVPRRAK